MIRRTFKARTTRNSIINKLHKVWWPTVYTLNPQHEQQLVQLAYRRQLDRQQNQRNLITDNLITLVTPRLNCAIIPSYQPLNQTSLVLHYCKVKTQAQTTTKFANALNSGRFRTSTSGKGYFKWVMPSLALTPLSQKSFQNYFEQSVAFGVLHQVQSNDLIRYNRRLKQKRFTTLLKLTQGPAYSYRERFARTVLFRNKSYLKHSHLPYRTTRIKL